ncbi:MmcQ/YjbR family DNA-binding protein [Nocardioides nanhaiensis]|uniref:MmcQ/YjbR family DNA-binding protein n=1 Tax=Nocardioides nanhaiensis TaxID=1476871 RepID=A0ABP8WD24_9ACTN
MPCTLADAVALLGQLPGAVAQPRSTYDRWQVAGQTFGYVWQRTATVGLKQPLAEQLALVAERPEVFEVQFTAGAFGWVVVHLAGVERDELAELVFEAWRLTAPADVVAARADRLPR